MASRLIVAKSLSLKVEGASCLRTELMQERKVVDPAGFGEE